MQANKVSTKDNETDREPFISVVIPNYDGKEYLKGCLSTLTSQTYKNFETILVDDASKDDSVDYVKKTFPSVKIIANKETRGFAISVNAGVKNSSGEYIALLNNDTEVESDWLEEFVAFANAHPEMGSCQSKILLFKEKDLINSAGNKLHYLGLSWCGEYREKDDGRFDKIKEIPYSSGAAMLIRKDLFISMGLFYEEDRMYHEDVELGWKLMIEGYKNYYVPTSIVYHKYHFSRNKKKYYYLETGRLINLFTNYQLKTLIILGPAFVIMEVGMIAYSLPTRWIGDKFRSYRYILKNLGDLLKKRKQIQRTRKILDKVIFRNFDGKIQFEEIDNPLLKGINPLFNVYFKILKALM